MKNEIVTVLTVTYLNQLALIRERLEFECIEYFIQHIAQDELTAQDNPFSKTIGGINLQVRERDVEETIAILKEFGHLTDDDFPPLPKSFAKIEYFTSKIPIIRNMRFEFRLIVLFAILVSLITIGLIFFVTIPYQTECLMKNNWCVDYVTYEGKEYMPQTENVRRVGVNGICEERMIFYKEGRVTMPGFQTSSIHGKWILENDSLHISDVDTFANVYNGAYEIVFSKNGLTLKSEKTTVYCFSEPLNTLFQSDEMWEKYRK